MSKQISLHLKDLKSDEWLIKLMPMFLTHSISFVFLFITFVLHVCVPDLRKNIFGKFWMMFSVVSMLNYLNVIMFGLLFSFYFDVYSELKQSFGIIIFAVYYFFEFAVYSWLISICMELFLTIRWVKKSFKSVFQSKTVPFNPQINPPRQKSRITKIQHILHCEFLCFNLIRLHYHSLLGH